MKAIFTGIISVTIIFLMGLFMVSVCFADWFSKGQWTSAQLTGEALDVGDNFQAHGLVSCTAAGGCECRITSSDESKNITVAYNESLDFSIRGEKVSSNSDVVLGAVCSVDAGPAVTMYADGVETIIDEPWMSVLLGLTGLLIASMFIDGAIASFLK